MNFEIYFIYSLHHCLLFSKVLSERMQGMADKKRQGITARVVLATIPCRSRRMADSWKPGRPFLLMGNPLVKLPAEGKRNACHPPLRQSPIKTTPKPLIMRETQLERLKQEKVLWGRYKGRRNGNSAQMSGCQRRGRIWIRRWPSFDCLLWTMRLGSLMCLAANRSTSGGKSLWPLPLNMVNYGKR